MPRPVGQWANLPLVQNAAFFAEAERNEGSKDVLLLMADYCVLNRSAPGQARSTSTFPSIEIDKNLDVWLESTPSLHEAR